MKEEVKVHKKVHHLMEHHVDRDGITENRNGIRRRAQL
jgi:hypothetical protein